MTLQKDIPIKDEDYKSYIRTRPCIGCGCTGYTVAHHQPARGNSGMGCKVSDRRCLPLCRPHYFRGELVSCHDAYHQMSWPFWEKRGIDVEQLIERLNMAYAEERGDLL